MKTITNKNVYLINNKNIFESIRQRVSAGNNGATVFVPHVCNNIDLFGAGFAAQVASEFPSVKADYHMLGKKFLQNNLGYSQILKVAEEPKYRHKIFFVNMIAQNGIIDQKMNPRPLNYEALINCMVNLRNFIKNSGLDRVEIHAPKFGSLRAGGDWKFISDIIDDVWKNIPVMIYNYSSHRTKAK